MLQIPPERPRTPTTLPDLAQRVQGAPLPRLWVQDVQNTIVYRGSSAQDTIQDCVVRANFLLMGGVLWNTSQSAGLLVTGPVAPKLVRTAFIVQVRRRRPVRRFAGGGRLGGRRQSGQHDP
jgi:hypothetical protein